MRRSDVLSRYVSAGPSGPVVRALRFFRDQVRPLSWKQQAVTGAVMLWMLSGMILLAGCTAKPAPEPQRHPSPVREEPQPAVSRPQPTPAPAPSPSPAPPTARPYTVLGQTYHPLTTADGFAEEGIASWYGPQFHAKRTASGEVYNMFDLTAAHRVLPMQTKIRVTNLENGKSVVLRVNDRGPFVGNRVVDLSYKAAQELDVIRPGTAPVRVEALGRWPGGIPGRFFVQVGSYTQRENAARQVEDMRRNGYPGSRMVQVVINNQNFWRVQVGEFNNLDKAVSVQQELVRRSPGVFVIAD